MYKGENQLLLKFDSNNSKVIDYINHGVEMELHKRSHCVKRSEKRTKWYEVDNGSIPDAFFTYRVSEIPFMSFNPDKIQCTNSIHKVFFRRKLTANKQKWIAISLLSTVSQLSLEHSGRHYAGALKIEPSALKNTLVIIPDKKVSLKRFNKISKLLETDKRKAMLEATNYLKEVTNIPEELWNTVGTTLDEVKKRRL